MKKAIIKLFMLLLILTDVDAHAQLPAYEPIVLQMSLQTSETMGGQPVGPVTTYTVNLSRVDCTKLYPYQTTCGMVPTSGIQAAIASATVNGVDQTLPDLNTGGSDGIIDSFDVHGICLYYASIYSPICPGR